MHKYVQISVDGLESSLADNSTPVRWTTIISGSDLIDCDVIADTNLHSVDETVQREGYVLEHVQAEAENVLANTLAETEGESEVIVLLDLPDRREVGGTKTECLVVVQRLVVMPPRFEDAWLLRRAD